MTIAATCATIALALASAKGGETINLKGDCGPMTVAKVYPKQVTVNAGGATVRGLVIRATNLRWRSGTLAASGGYAAPSGAGYGVLIRGAAKVRIEGVLVTDANRGIVIDNSRDVTIADSRFARYGADAIIASAVKGFTVVRNRFSQVIGKATECTTAGGVVYGLAKRDCAGAWVDGWHADATQMRNGITDALIADNVVEGMTQGITQMDSVGDAPLERVQVERNRVSADAHHITLTDCLGCTIRGNIVRRFPGSKWRAVIRAGMARRCENDVQDEKPDGGC